MKAQRTPRPTYHRKSTAIKMLISSINDALLIYRTTNPAMRKAVLLAVADKVARKESIPKATRDLMMLMLTVTMPDASEA